MLIEHRGKCFDLSKPIDIGISLHDGTQLNCYAAPPFASRPVVLGDFVGDMQQGGLLNYKTVTLNPHGNGTHTECLSHVYDTPLTINQALKQFHFLAQLITLIPHKTKENNLVLNTAHIKDKIEPGVNALIIRTLPNDKSKLTRNYNKTNPPYLEESLATYLNKQGIFHLLVDLPSVDREEDGGKLAAHKAFWGIPTKLRPSATITELIYVPNEVKDGIYLLNLQIAAFELDATPSKPVLYPQL